MLGYLDSLDGMGAGGDAAPDYMCGERGAQAEGGGAHLVEQLRACRGRWVEALKDTADGHFVLEVLDNGLKLPFAQGHAPAEGHRNANNFIEDQDVPWVRAAVAELVRTGAVLQ